MLQPSRSGYFGPGSAGSASSSASAGQMVTRRIPDARDDPYAPPSSGETPLQKLIAQVSSSKHNAAKAREKKDRIVVRPPKLAVPWGSKARLASHTQNSHDQYESDEERLKAMFKSPPRS